MLPARVPSSKARSPVRSVRTMRSPRLGRELLLVLFSKLDDLRRALLGPGGYRLLAQRRAFVCAVEVASQKGIDARRPS